MYVHEIELIGHVCDLRRDFSTYSCSETTNCPMLKLGFQVEFDTIILNAICNLHVPCIASSFFSFWEERYQLGL